MISGNIIGQTIVVISSPILTRIYIPEDFGLFGIYLALTAFFTLIASLRYELGILLPKNEIIALALLVLSLILVIIIVTVVSIILIIFGPILLNHIDALGLQPYIWIIPFSVLLGGIYKAISYWVLRKKTFKNIFRARIMQDSSMVSTQLVMGLSNFGIIGLLIGHMFGVFIGMIAIFRYYYLSSRNLLSRLRWKHIHYAAVRYKKFPLFTTWADMANMASKHLPVILISSLFSPLYAGYYVLANRVGNMPVAMISEGASKAFFAEAPNAYNAGYLDKLSQSVFSLLLRISLSPFLLLIVIAPEMFALFFGENWFIAGEYVQLLILHMISVFVFIPVLTLIPVFEKQNIGFIFQITMLIVTIISFFIGSLFDEVKVAVVLYAISTSSIYAIFGLWILHFTGIRYRKLSKILMTEILFIIPFGLVLFLFKYYMLSYFVMAILCVIGLLFTIWLIVRIKYILEEIHKLSGQINS